MADDARRFTDAEIEATARALDIHADVRCGEDSRKAAGMIRQLLAERDAALAEVKAHEDVAEDRAIARDLARMPRNVR